MIAMSFAKYEAEQKKKKEEVGVGSSGSIVQLIISTNPPSVCMC